MTFGEFVYLAVAVLGGCNVLTCLAVVLGVRFCDGTTVLGVAVVSGLNLGLGLSALQRYVEHVQTLTYGLVLIVTFQLAGLWLTSWVITDMSRALFLARRSRRRGRDQ